MVPEACHRFRHIYMLISKTNDLGLDGDFSERTGIGVGSIDPDVGKTQWKFVKLI